MTRTIRVSLLLTVSGLSAGPAPAGAQVGGMAWAIGARAEYVAFGGEQFDQFTSGVGANGFLGVSLTSQIHLEIGMSVTRHQRYLICVFTHPCQPTERADMTGLYAQPTFHVPASARLTVYAGPRVGALLGDFQDGPAGLEVGAVGGLTLLVSKWMGLDAGVVGSMVYMGNPPAVASRGRFGRRATLRFGVILSP